MNDKYHEEQIVPVRTMEKTAPGVDKTKFERPKSPKKKNPLKIIGIFVIFIFTVLLVFSNQVSTSKQSPTSWFANLPIVRQLKHLAESADRALKGEAIDRINILLLGQGGRKHEGGYLTDTIMLASLEPSSQKVSLVSIPRDLTVPVEDMDYQKINSINAYAEMESNGSGGLAVCQAVSDILDMPIDYYVRVDFAGFIDIVDEMGGIDVDVERTLNDYRYPIMGMEKNEDYEARFEHLRIEAGLQHMDGGLALKYSRSRHALGSEGSDFARARRQQIIISAAKDKLLSRSTLLSPAKIINIINELDEHIATNLKAWEMIKIWDKFKNVNKEDIITRVLDNDPNGLLIDTITEEGAYVLVPRSGDFAEIQYFINNIFSDAPIEQKNVVINERSTIEVRNGTWINGLASQMALDLEKIGFTVIRIGNSSRQNFQKSIIYDLSYGEKSESMRILKKYTNANISFSLPDWLVDEISQELKIEKNPIQPDFILILGHDADATGSGAENPENLINTNNN
ncbi:LCP family protein [Candidatus Parcubacteria bacterium]|nr:LCP family protein [Candidatus Parcubacteria bacterium]